MKYWVGTTDNAWFLFKLKRPYNHIAGGAHFVKSTSLPLSMVWDAFGAKNGAATRPAFESMIRKLLADPAQVDPIIGCTVLTEPFFWPESEWIPEPESWNDSIVRGRYYDTGLADGAALWRRVGDQLQANATGEKNPAKYGEPIVVKPRLGQGGFRVVVTDAYKRRCAITGESTLPVLEAAHILPYAENGAHEARNGLLLRSDFHKLFDLGLLTATPSYEIEISPRIKEDWCASRAWTCSARRPAKSKAAAPAASQ